MVAIIRRIIALAFLTPPATPIGILFWYHCYRLEEKTDDIESVERTIARTIKETYNYANTIRGRNTD